MLQAPPCSLAPRGAEAVAALEDCPGSLVTAVLLGEAAAGVKAQRDDPRLFLPLRRQQLGWLLINHDAAAKGPPTRRSQWKFMACFAAQTMPAALHGTVNAFAFKKVSSKERVPIYVEKWHKDDC